jgi:hypothetical protein
MRKRVTDFSRGSGSDFGAKHFTSRFTVRTCRLLFRIENMAGAFAVAVIVKYSATKSFFDILPLKICKSFAVGKNGIWTVRHPGFQHILRDEIDERRHPTDHYRLKAVQFLNVKMSVLR